MKLTPLFVLVAVNPLHAALAMLPALVCLLLLPSLGHGALPIVVDPTFDPGSGANGPITGGITVAGGKVVIWGDFDFVQGQQRRFIARLNPDGAVDTSFDPGGPRGLDRPPLSVLELPDGKLMLAGGFNFNGPVTRRIIARLHTDGSIDPGFHAVGYAEPAVLNNLALLPDGQVLARLNHAFLHLVRFATNGTPTSVTLPPEFTVVDAVVVQPDGAIIVGAFADDPVATHLRLARLQPNGAREVTYPAAPLPIDVVMSLYGRGNIDDDLLLLTLQPDGKLLLASRAAALATNSAAYGVFRLHMDGTLDTTFNPRVAALGYRNPTALLSLSDGRVLLSGTIGLADGTQTSLLRLQADGSADTSFNPELPVANDSTPDAVQSAALAGDGTLLVAGNFTAVAGARRAGVARLFLEQAGDARVEFAQTETKAREDSGSSLLRVIRRGDTNAACTVSYSTSNLTATAGADFHAANNAIAFAPGEVERAILIQLLDDGAVEGLESFVVLLHSASGASIGAAATCRVAIEDNERPVVFDYSFHAGTGVTPSYTNASIIEIYDLAPLPDGKTLVLGNFRAVQGLARKYLARLNADGSVDPSFNTDTGGGGFNDEINDFAILPDGKILVVGFFSTINGTSRPRIARLNQDGSLDATFIPGSGANNFIFRLAVQPDGGILISGGFSQYGTASRHQLARLQPNGTLDPTFNPGGGPAGNSYATLPLAVQTNGQIIVGGDFTSFAGATRTSLALLDPDGVLDPNFAPKLNHRNFIGAPLVNHLRLQSDGRLVFASGQMTGVDGVPRGTLARLNPDGTLDSTFDAHLQPGGYVRALEIMPDSDIVACGSFTFENGDVRPVIRLKPDGSRDASFDTELVVSPGAYGGGVSDLAVAVDGSLVISGSFETVAGVRSDDVARLLVDGSSRRAVEFPGPRVVVTEGATNANVMVRRRGASDEELTVQLAASQGAAAPAEDFLPTSVTVTFAPLQTEAIVSVPILDDYFAENEEAFSCSLSETSPGVIAGRSTEVVIYDDDRPGSLDATLRAENQLNLYFSTFPVLLSDGSFYALTFSATGSWLLKFQADGSMDDTFEPLSGATFAAKLTDGQTLVCLGNTTLQRLTSEGLLDPNFHATIARDDPYPPSLTGVLVDPSGALIIFGGFHRVNGVARTSLARLQVDGSLDASFNVAIEGDVTAAARQSDGRIVLAGSFQSVGGLTRPALARIDASGSVDASFNAGTGPDDMPLAMVVQPDDKVIVGGGFNTFTSANRPNVVRLNPNGAVDPTFSVGLGAQSLLDAYAYRGYVYTLALQPDGRLMVGGDFVRFSGVAAPALVRLQTNGAVDRSFSTGDLRYPPSLAVVQSLALLPDGDMLTFGAPLIARVNGDGVLRIVNATQQSSALTLTANTLPGRSYTLLGSSTLVAQDFQPLETRMATTNRLDFVDPRGAGAGPMRFYRVSTP